MESSMLLPKTLSLFVIFEKKFIPIVIIDGDDGILSDTKSFTQLHYILYIQF